MTEELQSLLRRLDATERNHTDLAASHTRQVEHFTDMEKRLAALETIYSDRRVDDARREEREKSMSKDIADVKEDVRAIKGGFNKLLLIVATPIVGAIILFITKGGLTIG